MLMKTGSEAISLEYICASTQIFIYKYLWDHAWMSIGLFWQQKVNYVLVYVPKFSTYCMFLLGITWDSGSAIIIAASQV